MAQKQSRLSAAVHATPFVRNRVAVAPRSRRDAAILALRARLHAAPVPQRKTVPQRRPILLGLAALAGVTAAGRAVAGRRSKPAGDGADLAATTLGTPPADGTAADRVERRRRFHRTTPTGAATPDLPPATAPGP